MSNAARKHLGIRNSDKHATLPTHESTCRSPCDVSIKIPQASIVTQQLLIACVMNQEAIRSLQEMVFLQENPNSSESFYTSEHDVSIFHLCIFPNVTI